MIRVAEGTAGKFPTDNWWKHHQLFRIHGFSTEFLSTKIPTKFFGEQIFLGGNKLVENLQSLLLGFPSNNVVVYLV
jgi:hypothetical protein